MDESLLYEAYHLHKQGSETHRAASLDALQANFAGTAPDEIERAFSRAGELIAAACEWADQYRGPQNDGAGSPVFRLEDRCPGFPQGIYRDAEAWGLYLTK